MDGKKGIRNSPAIFNMAWNESFMWDGGINHIEVMPLAPITNPVEMDLSMLQAVERVNANQRYRKFLFLPKEGDTFESSDMLKALAAFMSSIVSFNSKYDQVMQGQSVFTANEKEGYVLFKKYCNECHTEPLFQSLDFRSNRNRWLSKDAGRYKITLDSLDYGKFKVPTLRNLSFSYPYMHNGSERNLNELLSNYLSMGESIYSDDSAIQNLYSMSSAFAVYLLALSVPDLSVLALSVLVSFVLALTALASYLFLPHLFLPHLFFFYTWTNAVIILIGLTKTAQ